VSEPTETVGRDREQTETEMAELRGRGYDAADAWTGLVDPSDPEARVPIVASPDEVWVVVAGGDGRHSAWMPAWNVCRGATEIIEEA
jgi:hypothetical protein